MQTARTHGAGNGSCPSRKLQSEAHNRRGGAPRGERPDRNGREAPRKGACGPASSVRQRVPHKHPSACRRSAPSPCCDGDFGKPRRSSCLAGPMILTPNRSLDWSESESGVSFAKNPPGFRSAQPGLRRLIPGHGRTPRCPAAPAKFVIIGCHNSEAWATYYGCASGGWPPFGVTPCPRRSGQRPPLPTYPQNVSFPFTLYPGCNSEITSDRLRIAAELWQIRQPRP